MFNGDTLLATVDQQTAGGVATGTAKTRYIHPDHLGSTNVVTDENDNIVQTLTIIPMDRSHLIRYEHQRTPQIQWAITDDWLSQQPLLQWFTRSVLSEDPLFLWNPAQQNLKDPQGLIAMHIRRIIQ